MKNKFCSRKRMLTHRKVVNRNLLYWSLLLQSKVKRRKILSNWRQSIFFAKKRKRKKNKKQTFWQRKTLLGNNTATQSDKNFAPLWKFLNILCKTEVWAYSTVCKNAQKYKYACRQFANKLPTVCCTMSTTETKKRPERGRLIYFFLRLCFSPSPSGFICFSTVGTTKTFLCNSETRACM